jgi:hypothetical protein
MLFPALGMTTAIWLVFAPLLGVETGFRAGFTVTAGLLALILAPLGVRYKAAAYAVGALGIVLGFANFVMWAPIGGYVSLSTCAVTLLIAGMAPVPTVVPVVRATELETDRTSAAPAAPQTERRIPIAA